MWRRDFFQGRRQADKGSREIGEGKKGNKSEWILSTEEIKQIQAKGTLACCEWGSKLARSL